MRHISAVMTMVLAERSTQFILDAVPMLSKLVISEVGEVIRNVLANLMFCSLHVEGEHWKC